MRIASTAALTVEQTAAIETLHQRCADHDGAQYRLLLDTAMNLDPQMPAIFLAYEEEEPIGYAVVFHGDEEEAEVIAATSPRYRRRGVFTALLAALTEELRGRGVTRILLQCNPFNPAGPVALAAMGLHAKFSEYVMLRSLETLLANDGRLHLHVATIKELEAVCALAGGIFDDDPVLYRAFLTKALAAEDMTVFTAQLDGEAVGLCRMIWSEQPPYLCTFGILPGFRGRGLGQALLAQVLAQAAARGCIQVSLDVNSANAAAFALYQKNGFQVQLQIDYYPMNI